MENLLFFFVLAVSFNLVKLLPSKGNLLFVDDFNGNSVDETKWDFVTGNGCGGSTGCGFGNWVSKKG